MKQSARSSELRGKVNDSQSDVDNYPTSLPLTIEQLAAGIDDETAALLCRVLNVKVLYREIARLLKEVQTPEGPSAD